jgi:hypothetical protein
VIALAVGGILLLSTGTGENPQMESISLIDMAEEKLTEARTAHSGRAAHTIHGGHDRELRQTVMALAAGMNWPNTTARARRHFRCYTATSGCTRNPMRGKGRRAIT